MEFYIFFILSFGLLASGAPLSKSEIRKAEYSKYLHEILDVLDEDPSFKNKLQNAKDHNISISDLARHVELMESGIRTRLDDLKAREVFRLRSLLEQKMLKEKNADLPRDFADHVHHDVEHFSTDDLEKLIHKAIEDLDQLDELRRAQFRHYELEKAFLRKKRLEHLNEEDRKKEQQKWEEEVKKHKKHEPILHPGSEDQLKEVWEDVDHMEKSNFDPKTFFMMHDLDGNGMWDEEELESLFEKELDKVYDKDADEDDMVERFEEMSRMREHVLTEMDGDKDKMVSRDEFLKAAKNPDFDNDVPWKTIDEEPQYSDDELEDFDNDFDDMVFDDLPRLQTLPPEIHRDRDAAVSEHDEHAQKQNEHQDAPAVDPADLKAQLHDLKLEQPSHSDDKKKLHL